MPLPNTITSSRPRPSSRLTFLNAKKGISVTNIIQGHRSKSLETAFPYGRYACRGSLSLDEACDHFLKDVEADEQ